MDTQVEIFGTHYTFDGDNPELVRQLADYVDRKMSETAKSIRNVTTSKVAVLAAMNLAEELFRLRDSVDHSTRTNADRLDKLIALSKLLAASPAEETDEDEQSTL